MHVCSVSNSTEIMLGQHFLTEVVECLNNFNFESVQAKIT